MYKVKMFSSNHLDDIVNDINFFIDGKGITDWELVGNVTAANYQNAMSNELEVFYVATMRYWEGNNR